MAKTRFFSFIVLLSVLIMSVLATGIVRAQDAPIASDEERVRAVEKWKQAAGNRARELDEETALFIFNTVIQHTAAIAVRPDGLDLLQPAGRTAYQTGVLPLFEGDDQIGNQRVNRHMLSGPAFITYSPADRIFIINTYLCISARWQGIVFLRGALSAYGFFTHRYDHSRPMTAERVTAGQEAQNRWVTKLGGSEYGTLLREEMDRLRMPEITQTDGFLVSGFRWRPENPAGSSFALPTSYDSRLDEIFTPACSEEERVWRSVHLWSHAVFTLCEQDAGAAAGSCKRTFTEQIFEAAGVYADRKAEAPAPSPPAGKQPGR